MNKSNSFLFSFLGLIILQIFMSMEEIIGHFPSWITILTGKIHNRISLVPVFNISEQAFMFLSLVLIIILFIFLAVVFVESRWSRVLAVILGVAEIINGVMHIVTSLYFMKYVPGSISAVGLIFFGFLVIILKPSYKRDETIEVKQP
jgi:hypothetical protein